MSLRPTIRLRQHKDPALSSLQFTNRVTLTLHLTLHFKNGKSHVSSIVNWLVLATCVWYFRKMYARWNSPPPKHNEYRLQLENKAEATALQEQKCYGYESCPQP
jgi:hypothetical protein